MSTKLHVDDSVEIPQSLIDQINEIVPGRPAADIKAPSRLVKKIGKLASLGARFLIWFDASLYSMLSWCGQNAVIGAYVVFHLMLAAALTGAFVVTKHLTTPDDQVSAFCLAIGMTAAIAALMSLPLMFLLYAFEFSLMGKAEKLVAAFNNKVGRRISGEEKGETFLYEPGNYKISVYHSKPNIWHCVAFWPMISFFMIIEFLAHYLLVIRDYALGNRYGTYVLLPEDWVEFYKEVPLEQYTGFVPEHFKRRLEQVIQDVDGETFVLIPFGIMPGHLPGIETIAQAQWKAHLEELEKPKGDPVLARRLDDKTKFGRMLVVGHWMTLATLQKTNLLFRAFDVDAERLD